MAKRLHFIIQLFVVYITLQGNRNKEYSKYFLFIWCATISCFHERYWESLSIVYGKENPWEMRCDDGGYWYQDGIKRKHQVFNQ